MTVAYNADIDLTVEIAFGNDPLDSALTWTDVSAYVRLFTYQRGRSHERDRAQAGTAVIRLANQDRTFDPTYAAGPYYGDLKPMVPIRIYADHNYGLGTHDSTHDSTHEIGGKTAFTNMFSGYVEDFGLNYIDNDSYVDIQAVDAFKLMAMWETSTAQIAESSGTRVDNLLDDMGWSAGLRHLDPGTRQVQAISPNCATVLSLAQGAADAEDGMFFISGDGAVTFHDADHRDNVPVTATYTADLYADVEVNYDDTNIWNHVITNRAGGPSQTVSDAASQTAYGKRTLKLADRAYGTDAEAAAVAARLLATYKDPMVRIDQIIVRPEVDADTLWPRVFNDEIGALLIVEYSPPGGGTDIRLGVFIEGIRHDVTPGGPWRTTYQLSPFGGGPLWWWHGATAAWWSKDYVGSGDLLDVTGNGHDATVVGPTFLPHDGSNYMSIPTGAVLNNAAYTSPNHLEDIVTTRYEIIVDCELTDLTSATYTHLFNATGSHQTYFTLHYLGKLYCYLPDAVDASQVFISTVTLATAGLASYTRALIRVVIDGIDTTSWTGDFSYSLDDGDTWTAIGAQVPKTATAGIHNGNYQYWTFGGYSASDSNPVKIYGTRVFADGREVVRSVPSDIAPTRTALDLDGTGDYASIPDSDDFTPTTALDVRWFGALDSYAAQQWLVSHYKSATNERSWAFEASSNSLKLHLSTTGSTVVTATCPLASFLVDSRKYGLRATWDQPTGDVEFFAQDPAGEWVSLGTASTAVTSALKNPATTLEIGSGNNGTFGNHAGQDARAIVIVDGVTVADVDFNNRARVLPGDTSFVCNTGQTVTLNGDAAIVPDGQLRIHDSTPTFLSLDGVSGSRCRLENLSAYIPTASMDIRVRITPDSWTAPLTLGALVALFEASGYQQAYDFSLDSSKKLRLRLSPDGSTNAYHISSVVTPFTDFETGWVRSTWTSDGTSKFYYSYADTNDPDEVTWTQLGTTKTDHYTSVYASTQYVEIGQSDSANWNWPGKMHRVRVEIDGVTQIDLDFTTLVPGVTEFTEATAANVLVQGNAAILGGSQVWTVNRAASGLVTTLVGEPLFVLDGINDYFEIPDHDDLDLIDDGELTAVLLWRSHNYPTYGYVFAKYPDGSAGWLIYSSDSGTALTAFAHDGITYNHDVSVATSWMSSRLLALTGRFATADIEAFVNGVGSGSPITRTIGDSSVTVPLRIGMSPADTYPTPGEFIAAGVWRRALTDAEILDVAEQLLAGTGTADTNQLMRLAMET